MNNSRGFASAAALVIRSLLIFCLAFFMTPRGALAEIEQPEAYARLLDSLAHDSPAGRIQRLQDFIPAQPEEERGYLKLLEQYQVQQNPEAAKLFFETLVADSQYQRNSLWMQAKLAAGGGLREKALPLFVGALKDRTRAPSPALLYDFAAFCHENFPLSEHENLIRRHLPRAEPLALALGFYRYLNGSFEQAETAFKQASPSKQKAAHALYVWSDCVLRNERRPKAGRCARADSIAFLGLFHARQNNDKEWQARFEARLGDIAYERDAIEQAQASYERAYDLANACHEAYVRQSALGGFGKIRHMLEDYEAADSLYRAALVIAERIHAYREASLLYSNQCQLYTGLGRFAQALEACAASERYADRGHDEEGLVRIQTKQARLYHDLFQDQFAKSLATQARALAEKRKYVKHYHRAQALLADIAAREQKFDEARKFYDEYLAYLSATGNRFERHSYLAKKADTYKAQGERHYDEAIALYQQAGAEAAQAKYEYYQAWYLLEIADLETKRERLEQAELALKAVAAPALQGSEEGLIRFNLSLGELLQRSGKFDHAIAAYREAAALIDLARPRLRLDRLRLGYFSDRTRAAQGLAECYYQRYQTSQTLAERDSLFYFLETAKGRSFQDLAPTSAEARPDSAALQDYLDACAELQMLQRRMRLEPENDEALRPQWEIARYSVVYQRPRFASARESVAQTRGGRGNARADVIAPLPGVSSAGRDGALQNHGNGVYPFAQAQKFLRQPRAALLLYHVSEQAAFVFVATETEARAVPLRAARPLLVALRDSLMAPFHADTLSAESLARLEFRAGFAHRLYELLLKPVEEAVALPPQLIIVPEPALTNLPFEMFLSNAPAKAVYTPEEPADYAKDFLLHRYAFAYSPTFGMAMKNRNAPGPRRGVLVLANPSLHAFGQKNGVALRGRAWPWEPLPFTELEAERIAELYAPATKRTRAQATEAAFFTEAPQHRVVHLASHAFVDSAYHDFSGLALALGPDSTDDGLLMGYEIAERKLACDLVTLSACQTGTGALVEGEGALGLPRLFLRTGAKSVMMTLWQVDDRFAAELIPAFYEQYLNQGLAKIDALAQAKRALLRREESAHGRSYQHPFYWAAFTLYGDPGQNETRVITPGRAFLAGASLALLFALFFYFRHRLKRAEADE